MYYFEIIAIDRETEQKTKITLPCTEWEVCCLLVSNTGQKIIEFKKYRLNGTQETKLFYIESFTIKSNQHDNRKEKINTRFRVNES